MQLLSPFSHFTSPPLNSHQTVREMVSDSASVGHSSKAVMDSVVVNNASRDLAPLARTDARVFLLYSTHEEAKHILQEVRERERERERERVVSLRYTSSTSTRSTRRGGEEDAGKSRE